ncbi:MAG: transposase [Patescibacteria group bacterium]
MKNPSFAVGEYYHIYNRGVDKRSVFSDADDVDRFLLSLDEFNQEESIGSIYEHLFIKGDRETVQLGNPIPKLVDIISFCLNGNHFHLLLKQNKDGGISKFMQKVGIGYTNYFNEKNKRSGALFQGKFKAKHIDSNEYLLRVGVYINLNNMLGYKKEELSVSSWNQLLGEEKGFCVGYDVVVGQFKNRKSLEVFAEEVLADIKRNKLLQAERVFLD